MKGQAKDRISELFADGAAIDRALKRAVQEAVARHRRLGFPVVTWRDGKVVWIPPEQITVTDTGEIVISSGQNSDQGNPNESREGTPIRVTEPADPVPERDAGDAG